ncbi:MAG TPA: hypothetical protein VFT31_08440 [Kribbella sp.]|nr:hypothetical protein [Kribbella sp.]
MGGYSPAEIVARLEAGEDPATLAATLLPAGIRTALRYAAPLRWLTAGLWEQVVARHAPGVALAELHERDLVRELPREPGRFVLADETRAAYLQEWDSGELRRYSAELAEAFAGDDRERLYHLMPADRNAAVALFEKLFIAADARFDLTTARDLLDLFERPDRRQVVDQSLAARLAQWRAQLDTRAAWSTDYYRSAGFLDRPAYRDLLEELLAGESIRALQLVAMGGMGKTMLLRSFIARRCIPARIFVARIDFDDIEPAIAARHPWLIRIALAQQLNEQSPAKYFDTLLSDRRRLLPALYRDTGRETSAALRELATLGDTGWLASEVTARYDDSMDRLAGAGSPVVFMFDTLEVPILRTDLDTGPLVETMLDTYRRPADSRLVLAGRYDIRDRADLDSLAGRSALHTVQLANFTEEEARTYLTEVRGIDQPEIVDAVLAKRDLMPFTVALYGDLAAQVPELTAADVEAFEDPRQLYLIERVLERIDDQAVLYALRYGVVARRLDKTFFAEVLMPYITAALRGEPVGDDPDLDPHERIKARFRIQGEPRTAAEVDEVWQRLTSYASNQSWVSFVHDAGEYLSFHPNVREPMRLVLERQEVLRLLHDRSFDYFRSLMAAQPHRLVQWAEEAAYHVFHARGPEGDGGWRDLLAEVERVGGPGARGDLAAALTADTDLTANGGTRPGDWFEDRPVMTAETLAEAHLEVALARLSEPGMFADVPWRQVELRLSTVESMEQEAGRALVDPERRAAAQVALQARDDGPKALAAVLEQLGQTEDLTVLDALAGVAVSYAGAIGTDRLARLAARTPTAPEVEAALHMLLASLFLAEGDTISAEEQATLVARIAGADELTDFDVWLALTRGAPTEAARLLAAQPPLPNVVVRQGRAALLAQDPDAALEAAHRLSGPGSASGGSTVLIEAGAAAVVSELNGRAAAAWGDADEAVRWLDEAASRWLDAGDLLREADVRLTTARILLDEGRVLEAGRHLEAAVRVTVPIGHDLWIGTRLLQARWSQRSGRESAAERILDELLAELERRPRGPVALAKAAVEGLAAQGSPDRQRYLRLLARAVSMFRPTDAALSALDGLDRCAPIGPGSPPDEAMASLVRLLDPPTAREGRYGVGDEALRSLRRAELARVLGDVESAERWLQAAADAKLGPGSLIHLRTMETAARLHRPLHNLEAMAIGFVQRHGNRPALALDALIAWARASRDERWMEHADEMLRLLEHAGGPSRRNAEVMQLRAEAVRAGHAAEDPAELADLSARLYETLGDEAALRRLRMPEPPVTGSIPPPGQVSPPSPAIPHQPGPPIVPEQRIPQGQSWRTTPRVVDAQLYDEDGMLVVETGGTRWKQPSVLVAPEWRAGSSWFLSDVQDLVKELRRPLGGLADGPDDARLRIVSPQLAELPWELAWPPDREQLLFRASRDGGVRRVMRVQRALTHAGHHLVVDGVIGPQTERAIEAYQERLEREGPPDIESSLWEAGPDRPTALVLQLSHQVQLQKGMPRTTGEVSTDYELAGFDTVVIDDPTSRDVSALSYPCSVVHVQASLESRGDSASLSFDSGRTVRHSSEYGLEVLTVTALHDLLMRLTTGLGPIVVLEAIAPDSRLEVVRQVLLRNLFATQLFELGYASAVLAVGPVPSGAENLSTQLVAPALAGRLPGIGNIGDLYRELRRSPWEPRLREHLAVAALLAEEPAAVRLR